MLVAQVSWIGIAVAVIVALVALLVVLLVLVMFFGALIEKRRIMHMIILEDADLPKGAAFGKLHDQAGRLDLLYVGTFRDEESNIVKSDFTLYLSEDANVLLMIPAKPSLLGYRFITRTSDGIWMMTGEVAAPDDLTGMIDARNLPECTMAQVLTYHRDRVAARGLPVVTFAVEALVDDLREKDQLVAERSIAMGMARWITPQNDVWRYNLRGAFKQVGRLITSVGQTVDARNVAEQYKSR